MSLQMLEGAPYARFAAPIEYPPSSDYRPRWAGTQPAIPLLESWFRENIPQYRSFLSWMRGSTHRLSDIPIQFEAKKLPLPAWAGVPYVAFDGLALYAMIAAHKPRLYLEIGSGITTCWAHRAIKDFALDARIVSIDPSPRTQIDAICGAVIRAGL